MNYMIGLDIGTSSVKGVLFSESGKIKKHITKKHNYHTYEGLKVLDADKFCKNCFEVLKNLGSELENDEKVLAICSSGASGNIMFLKDGKPISPVYGWQNSYDEEITEKVISSLDTDYVYKTTGWPKLKCMPLPAFAYIREKNPQMMDNSDMICMHIEYLNYRLTGNWGITMSMGTTFNLINHNEKDYDKKILSVLGIDREKLPPIMDNCTVLGFFTEKASEDTGIDVGTPVVLGTFDHPSAARGAGVFFENEILISCGTSWVVFVPYVKRENPQSKNMLTDPYMAPKGNWCGMKSMTSVSEKIDKYIKKYLGNISFEELDTLADSAPVGANGLELGDNTNTEGYSKNDIARAIMESIAKGLVEFLEMLNVKADTIRLVGGITKSKVWIRVISEVTGKRVEVVNGEHAGAVGSAIMAGVGIGLFENEIEAFNSIYRKEV